jgi:hypothetical protein
MVKTVNITAQVGPNREVRVTLPDDFPVGPAEITLIAKPIAEEHLPTLGDLLESEFFGMWKDRKDIVNSSDFARKVRKEGWKRGA